MSQSVHLRKYGVEAKIDFELYEIDGVDFRVDAADAGADCTVMKDEGAEATCTNDFVDEGMGYSLTLDATEMQAARIVVYIVDSATKVWLDKCIIIETYGHASAMHEFDLDTALDSNITTIASDLIVADSNVDSILSDLIVADAIIDTTYSDTTAIASGVNTVQSDLVITDAVVDTVYSDTTAIASGINTAQSDLVVIDSNLDAILSDLVVADAVIDTIYSDTTVVASGINTVQSDLIITDAIVDTTYSDTTAIASGINTAQSDLVVIDSNLDTAISDIAFADAVVDNIYSDLEWEKTNDLIKKPTNKTKVDKSPPCPGVRPTKSYQTTAEDTTSQ